MPEQQTLNESVSLAEAAGGKLPKNRRFRARIIAGDIQGSSGYYPASMLKRDAGVFREGLPVFLDHPGASEAYERPERSVRDLAGHLASTAVYERDGLYADVEVYPHWAPVIEAMAEHIGMSIRASGTVEASTDPKVPGPIVTSLTEAASVDFVTAAGAGGKVVALLESARAQSGDLLRKAVDTRATPKNDIEVREGLADETRATITEAIRSLAEARNVGHWLESRIHCMFTELADGMFGDGRLTREERISLSNAIGEGLAAFNRVVADKVPHLYQRDLWDDPQPASTEVSEAEVTTVPAPPAVPITKGAPMSGSTNPQGTPPDGGAVTEVTESATSRELAETRRLLEEARAQLAQIGENAQRANAAERELAEAKAENARLRAGQVARERTAVALAESGLPEGTWSKVTATVCSAVPLTEAGVVDDDRLAKAIAAAIDDKKAEVASILEAAGVGTIRGLGESEGPSVADLDVSLSEAFAEIGLSDREAKIAVNGRA